MKKSEVIRKAIELIKKNGWTTKSYADESGCLCGLGGVVKAINSDFSEAWRLPHLNGQYYLFLKVAEELSSDLAERNFCDFNDAQKSRTPVLRQMGRTARRLEKAGQ